mmetsp:Transcript_44859/g.72192  ORF Transcript_44859/g.72192 Transcript_44859/m.72192 type:complete len:294 (-) Transcript_44859:318-1199(-)
MHSRVALFVLAGLCLEAGAYVPQRLPLLPPSARRAACRAPALRVAMQFQTTSSARDRQAEFAMPKSAPISSKRQPEGPLEDDPSLPMIEDIIRSLDARKAEGIWAVRVAHLTYTTEFFINCHGTSRPMLQAIAGSVEDAMNEKHERSIKWQGNPDSGWILLDYGEVIVNIMTEQAREFYDLEDHWSNGELIPLEGLVSPMDEFEAKRISSSFDFVDDEDWGGSGVDPFAAWDKLDSDNKTDEEEEEWDGVWGEEEVEQLTPLKNDDVVGADTGEDDVPRSSERKVSKRFKGVL